MRLFSYLLAARPPAIRVTFAHLLTDESSSRSR
jgi:hypothetical protein